MSELDAAGLAGIAVTGFMTLAQLPDARRVGRFAEMRNDLQAAMNFGVSAVTPDRQRASALYLRADRQNHNQYVEPRRTIGRG
ncbi:hypothetical protein [Embleya sp. NBC_00896]|uniref:hypothetical protein n=1 Tax=Embleya sp. NBC_00896 TaxID=2975961 RepID=UPI00386D9D8A|nr:hypothetical protein OG928_31645 [Embleya sp. NBC_00896]